LSGEASQAEDGQQFDAALLAGGARQGHIRWDTRPRDGDAAMGIPVRDGRLIASAKTSPGQRAFCLQDPDRHWIEIIEEQRQ
jgi:hypothetical protein